MEIVAELATPGGDDGKGDQLVRRLKAIEDVVSATSEAVERSTGWLLAVGPGKGSGRACLQGRRRMELRVGSPFAPKSGRKILAVWLWLSAAATLEFAGSARPAMSQELEPRSYSASPIDSNFAVGSV